MQLAICSTPNRPDQVLFARVEDAWNMGCVGVGATVYFGSAASRCQLQEVSEVFARSHELGMVTILFCYFHQAAFRKQGAHYELAADLTGPNNLQQAVRTAVIDKRAGGLGLLAGRKVFQGPMREGIELLNAIQDVYLDERIALA